MMHKAEDIIKAPYCLWGHSSDFKVTWVEKWPIWPLLFWKINLIWIQGWPSNDTHSLEELGSGSLSFFRSSVKVQGHSGRNINDFMDLDPIWVRLLGRPHLSNPSDLHCFIYSKIIHIISWQCAIIETENLKHLAYTLFHEVTVNHSQVQCNHSDPPEPNINCVVTVRATMINSRIWTYLTIICMGLLNWYHPIAQSGLLFTKW